jgi:hypothetical protein
MFTKIWDNVLHMLDCIPTHSRLQHWITANNPQDRDHVEKLIQEFHRREGSGSWL